MANSIEEQIEGYYKEKLKDLGIRFYAKNEPINTQISTALANSVSKSGGSGMNYPDIKLLLENSTRRDIPVMIEAKGLRGKLEKLDKDGQQYSYFDVDECELTSIYDICDMLYVIDTIGNYELQSTDYLDPETRQYLRMMDYLLRF